MPLLKSQKAADWIHDFVHSKNKKFRGKSKEQRIRMALGAYYSRNEDAVPVNNVGGGNIAGLTGDPPIRKKRRPLRSILRRNSI